MLNDTWYNKCIIYHWYKAMQLLFHGKKPAVSSNVHIKHLFLFLCHYTPINETFCSTEVFISLCCCNAKCIKVTAINLTFISEIRGAWFTLDSWMLPNNLFQFVNILCETLLFAKFDFKPLKKDHQNVI